jgi:hypothetical protein
MATAEAPAGRRSRRRRTEKEETDSSDRLDRHFYDSFIGRSGFQHALFLWLFRA